MKAFIGSGKPAVPGTAAESDSRLRASDLARAVAVSVALLSASACSSVPDTVNPVAWFDTSDEDPDSDKRSEAAKERAEAEGEKPFPKLSSVPDRPTLPDLKARKEALKEGLVADTVNARYTDEVIRREPPSVASAQALQAREAASQQGAGKEAGQSASSGGSGADGSASAETMGSINVPPPPPSSGSAGNPRSGVAVQAPSAVDAGAQPAPPKVTVPPPGGADKARQNSIEQAMSGGRFATPSGVPGSGASDNAQAANEPRPAPEPQPVRAADRMPERPVVNIPPPPSVNAPGRTGSGGSQATAGAETGSTRTASAPGASVGPDAIQLGTIYFPSGSASLDPASRDVVRSIAQIQRQQGGTIKVIGHSSGSGPSGDPVKASMVNFKVSLDRANSVAAELVRQGVSVDDMEVSAAGQQAPKYEESSAAGEAANRRVEVYMIQPRG